MLQAILKGKLSREEERMEDLLTSCVFGILIHTHPDQILIPFLRLAINLQTDESMDSILQDNSMVESVEFWPNLKGEGCHPCEPDVDIVIRDSDGTLSRIFIEAKYHSGKSSLPDPMRNKPYDQLAREFDNLQTLNRKKGITRSAVIYLTADYSCPTQDLKESMMEYTAKRGQQARILWLSWRKLYMVLKTSVLGASGMAHDLVQFLEYLNLTSFYRLRFNEVVAPDWGFRKNIRNWNWLLEDVKWRFGGP